MDPDIYKADNPDETCDQCDSQEEGRHYCLLHGVEVKNMDLMTCADWQPKGE